jgi:hypothetical protein
MPNTTTMLTFASLLLAGCVATGENGGAVVIPGAVNYHVAAASGCGQAIAAFEAVIDSDAQTGNLNKSVYRRVTADLVAVKNSCAAGRDPEATRQLGVVKARYGYR